MFYLHNLVFILPFFSGILYFRNKFHKLRNNALIDISQDLFRENNENILETFFIHLVIHEWIEWWSWRQNYRFQVEKANYSRGLLLGQRTANLIVEMFLESPNMDFLPMFCFLFRGFLKILELKLTILSPNELFVSIAITLLFKNYSFVLNMIWTSTALYGNIWKYDLFLTNW